MATKLITGTNFFISFSDGEGGGATSFFSYSPNLDINFISIQASVNGLVDEMRGVAGPNQTLPIDILTLDDPTGIGVTGNTLIGTDSYVPSFVSVIRIDVTKGVALVGSQRVAATSGVQLAPLTGTLDGGTLFNTIALDSNGAITNNSAPGAQALDIFRVEVDATPEFVVDTIEKVGTWQFVIDGDAWVEMSDATGLGSAITFTLTQFDEPKHRLNRLERALSGFPTDLQSPAGVIGPIRLKPGTEAAPGTILGDGAAVNDTGTGIWRPGVDRFAISSAGSKSLELDAAGNLDLPLNMRVKSRRTDSLTILDGGALTSVPMTAADEYDITAWHDPGGGSPENHVVPTDGDGTYTITANIEWATAVTNIRDIVGEIQVGSTLVNGGRIARALQVDEDHAMTWSVDAVLAAANVVRVQVSANDAVGALDLDVIDATLSIKKVA